MAKKRRDIAELLLDTGANPDETSWYYIFNTHDKDLIIKTALLRKDAKGVGEGISTYSHPVMGALKHIVPLRPDIGHELVYTALKELAIIYFKGWDPDDYSYDSYREDKKARRLVRAEKAYSILKWSGINIREKVHFEKERYEPEHWDCILGWVIRNGTAKQLKDLKPTRDDISLINAEMNSVDRIDEPKLRILENCGFKLNDRDDGTCSYLLPLIKRRNYRTFVSLASLGAKIPPLTPEQLKHLRHDSLFEYKHWHHLSEDDIRVIYRLLNIKQRDYFAKSSMCPFGGSEKIF